MATEQQTFSLDEAREFIKQQWDRAISTAFEIQERREHEAREQRAREERFRAFRAKILEKYGDPFAPETKTGEGEAT
jgi:hypothetical protein